MSPNSNLRGAAALAAILSLISGAACDRPAPIEASSTASASPTPSVDSPRARPVPDAVFTLRTLQGPRRLEVYFSEDSTRGFFVLGRGEDGWTSYVYPMWKALVADVDGDGTDEVLAGIWSNKQRHDEPQPHRTVWVFGLRDGRLYEQWRGSALSRPLVDFEGQRAEGGDFLIAQEREGARCVRTRYSWNGFGFSGRVRRVIDCPRAQNSRK